MILMLLVWIPQQIVPALLSKPFLSCSLFTNLEPFRNYVQLFRTITQEGHKTLQACRAHSKQKITIFRNNKTKWISMLSPPHKWILSDIITLWL